VQKLDQFDAIIAAVQALDDLGRGVGGAVVDKQDLVRVAHALHHRADLIVELLQRILFVEQGHDQRKHDRIGGSGSGHTSLFL